jgi:cation diffusion facilitator CzcD-associated flavoprotein CzcO
VAAQPEHVDVLIVGAGLSGIGAACRLRTGSPSNSFTILEARDAIGGTWDLFRYPGVRSDSDMFTLSYRFRPWTGKKSIADGWSIKNYIEETAREYRVADRIRYHHRVLAAEWSSEDARWTVTAERTDTGETVLLTCSWLSVCAGYYRYDEGFRPHFEGEESYRGQLVHPQHWPEDLDYAGKRVVVIGSGATAVTLVPAMAETAGHVTMLQRTPTYIAARPAGDAVADFLRGKLPAKAAYAILRWKNVLLTMLSYQLSKRKPELMKGLVRKGLEKQLPAGYDIDTHFSPPYNPWDQRFCIVPEGDLFRAIRHEKASVVTGHIETFTEKGVRLVGGEELEADIIVTATGLTMLLLGGITLSVDGVETKPADTVGYRGTMFSGIPNLAASVGYTNASWTLKCDLICSYVAGLLRHMDAIGAVKVVPRWTEPELPEVPFMDLQSGYILRSIKDFPKQGKEIPWRVHQNYFKDRRTFRAGASSYDGLEFSGRDDLPVSTPADVTPAAV